MTPIHPYDNSYEPPALIVDVTIIHPTNKKKIFMKGKIDTGADGTVIPLDAAGKLGLIPASEVRYSDFLQHTGTLKTYFSNITLDNFRFEFVEVAAAPRRTALIGRDVLNQLNMHCNGKEQFFSLEKP
ncbi:MAG: aspartyl protease family protein [Thaumarchaeota archaeon]|nr:aspartyl protease family protein [Nitrososphaerota archaeon]